jgi:hypothetical protein
MIHNMVTLLIIEYKLFNNYLTYYIHNEIMKIKDKLLTINIK